MTSIVARGAGALGLVAALGAAAFFTLRPRDADGRTSPIVSPVDSATAFVNVTVIPMDTERVLPGHTVLVQNGRITVVGPSASVRVPAGVMRIDGTGKYLMPGLAEMHAHVQGPQAANAADLNRDIMFLYVANGITTIRAMLGAPNQLILRDQLRRGEVLGPTMFVAAPSLNGQTAPNAETAIRLVREHKAAGYDLLKIHPGLTRSAYDAIVRTARSEGITWGGHVSASIGVDYILDTKQSTIDHLDGYIEAAASSDIRQRLLNGENVPPVEVWRSVTSERMLELARKTKEAGTWNVPTMFLWESFYRPGDPEEWARHEEMKYAPRQWVNGWINQKRQQNAANSRAGVSPADAALHIALRRRMLKTLADAGAPLLMGTDSPQMFNVPGFALHRELGVAREAGLTPFQILQSGSRNVAAYATEDLGLDGRFGTVSVGNRADLVLLNSNPLSNLANLSDRAGVMVNGRWVSRSTIDSGLAELAARYDR